MNKNILQELEKISIEQVIELLQMIRAGQNEKIKEATLYLKAFAKLKPSLGMFINIINSSQPLGVRQLSSILIDRSLKNNYADSTVEEQNFLKTNLLERYYNESERLVRKSIAHNITMIVKYSSEVGEPWTNIIQVLFANFTNGNEIQKELTLFLLASLFDLCGDLFEEYHIHMLQVLSQTIITTTGKIQVEALRCWAFLLDALDDEEGKIPPNLFENLPQILDIIASYINEEKEEDLLYQIFEVFVILIEEDKSILDNQLQGLTQFIANPKLLLNENLNTCLRAILVEVLVMISETKRTIYTQNLQLLEQTVTSLCFSTFDKSVVDDYYPFEEVILDALGAFAENLPKKKFYPIFMKCVKELLISGNEKKIANAFKMIGSISEGCCDYISKDLNVIINSWIVESLASGSETIREAITRMLSFFVSYVQPEIQVHHKIVVQVLTESLKHSGKRLNEKAMYGLDVFCHQTEKIYIEPHLQELAVTFLTIIQNPNTTSHIREVAFGALESVIRSVENAFEPYFADTYHIATQFLQVTDIKDLEIRAGSTAVLGSLCKVFCYNNIPLFRERFAEITTVVYNSLKLFDDPRIYEAGFEYFSAVAEAIGEPFGELLDAIIEPAFDVASRDMKLTSKEGEFSLDSDSDDEKDPSRKEYVASMPTLSAKASAIYAIGSFAFASGKLFVDKYLNRAVEILDNNLNFNYHAVREHAGRSYAMIAQAIVKAHNNGCLIDPENLQRSTPCVMYPEEVQYFIDHVAVHNLLNYILEDRDMTVVISAYQSLHDLIHALGAPSVANHIDEIQKIMILTIQNELGCFKKARTEEDEDNETVSALFIAMIDVMIACAEYLQLGWVKPSFEIYPHMIKHVEKTDMVDDIIEGIGCFTSILEKIPILGNQVADSLIKVYLETQKYNDDALNRNSVFGVGVLFEASPEKLISLLPKILVYLKEVLDSSELLETKENVIAAACRIYMASNGQGIPLENLLKLIGDLSPFKGDKAEFVTILNFYLYLAKFNFQVFCAQIEKIVQAMFLFICYPNDYPIPKKVMINFKQTFMEMMKEQQLKSYIEQQCAKLSPNEIAAVQQFLIQ